jgi:hypothetical protein
MEHFLLAASIMLRNNLPFSFYKPNFGKTLKKRYIVTSHADKTTAQKGS